MKLIKAVRGTKDIFGDEGIKYDYITRTAQEFFGNYGYSMIKTPIFEETDLFKRGVGEGTDIVEKEMYTFQDRGERSITLRPEGTAAVVRCYLENKIYAKEEVSRYFYAGSMFRYERPQAGRQREFNQIGVEVLGESSPILDAEVIAMGYSFLSKIGVTDLEVTINSVGEKESRQRYRETLLNFLEPMREELCDDCKMRMEKNPLRVLDCKVDKCKELTADAPIITDSLSVEEKAHYEIVKKYLTLFNVKYKEDPRLVRGLDYYSSTVYEIVTNKLGSQGTVLGGGRYDNLLKQLGDKEIPAFGFAAGVERIMMLLGEDFPKRELDVYIAWLGEATMDSAFKLANDLRLFGKSVVIDYASKGMKAHMKKADRVGAKNVIIIGEDEMNKGVVMLKDFINRTQEEVSIENIKNILK
ncbi:histidine--tRNA ligase [Cetobacterium sp. 2G large]|uniref:histidine--tRNA ligase n=2 Tax=unclassified Cetobacterium TaxID=2630983 RepID=UPI00163BF4EF|nr:histidine--tRNA ligase [Cetobacterium sp. 2G large]MBC2853039.1 histidine--tRNA ligase [Cetobacterium sp. 2G large]